MSDLKTQLAAMDVVPPKVGGQFDAWLEQKDALALFESNSADPELVVYASFRHTYIHAALVPVSKLDPVDVDDLLRWSCNPSETWGIWSTQSEVGITLPFDHPGSKTLTHAEQLVFTRRFDGHIGQKSYVEVLQKFTHIFDLHFVRERNAYCRIDKHGDVEDVIRIISMPSKREGWGNRLVTFNRRLLDEYMLVTKSALVRLFDVTRVDHDDFPGWGARVTTPVDIGALHARLTVEPGVGSYMRGFQDLRHGVTEQQVVKRVWGHDDEAKQYATFMAHDWKNSVVREISCDPEHLSNYFTKSEKPFEVSPAFFKPEVLRKYKADPEKYTLEERSISCRGAWHLETYDINEAGQVHTYLIYLSRLPYEEQLYWKSFNEAPKDSISRRAFTNDFQGEVWREYEPLSSLKHRVDRLCMEAVPWWTLRAHELMGKVHYPVTASPDEWAEDILALDQLLVEGFEEKWLRQKAVALGRAPDAQSRSLKLIEECLIGLGFDQHDALKVVVPLRELHDLRSKLKGHAAGETARALRSKAMSDHGSYKDQFKALCAECDSALEVIESALNATD